MSGITYFRFYVCKSWKRYIYVKKGCKSTYFHPNLKKNSKPYIFFQYLPIYGQFFYSSIKHVGHYIYQILCLRAENDRNTGNMALNQHISTNIWKIIVNHIYFLNIYLYMANFLIFQKKHVGHYIYQILCLEELKIIEIWGKKVLNQHISTHI